MSEPGTAAMVGWVALLHDVPPGHPVGGSGGLTAALRRRLESDGGRVTSRRRRRAAAHRRRRRRGVRVAGIETVGGRRVHADAVLAACHIQATRELAGDAAPPALADADPPLGNGFGLVVRALTDAPPTYPGVARRARRYRDCNFCAPTARSSPRAHGDWAAGRLPRTPVPLAMCFSASDDTLAPPGRHVVTSGGSGTRTRSPTAPTGTHLAEAEARRLIAAVDRFAPGFADSVQRLYVQTPLELERELSLPRGNVMHVEMGLASMFAFRPTPALSGYRVPGLRRALPRRRLDPPRRRGLGQLRPDGGPRAARRPARRRPRPFGGGPRRCAASRPACAVGAP